MKWGEDSLLASIHRTIISKRLPWRDMAVALCFISAQAAIAEDGQSLVEQSLVEANGQPLFVRWYGTATARDPVTLVIVLHGDAPKNKPDYQYAFAKRLARSSDRVVAAAILRPGYEDPEGNRSEGERGDATGDNWNASVTDHVAAAVKQLKRRFSPGRVVIVGHSGGAAIAANLLWRHPKLSDASLLVSFPGDVHEWRKHMLKTTGYEGYRGRLVTISPTDHLERVGDDVETVMIVGEKDKTTPPKLSAAYLKLARGHGKRVRQVVLSGQSHEILLLPEVFAETAKLVKD